MPLIQPKAAAEEGANFFLEFFYCKTHGSKMGVWGEAPKTEVKGFGGSVTQSL